MKRQGLCALVLMIGVAAFCEDGPAGIPEAPRRLKEKVQVFKSDETERSLEFRPTRGKRRARTASGAQAGSSAAKATGVTPPADSLRDAVASHYRFRSDEQAPPDPDFTFFASLGEQKRPIQVTARDGILYAGAQLLPMEGVTKLYVKESEAGTIRRLIKRRRKELEAQLRRAQGWQRPILEEQVGALLRLRVVGYELH